jgi:hypothetical protein
MGNIDNINSNTNSITQATEGLGITSGLLRSINNIKAAIEAKGGTVTAVNQFPSMAELKLGISTIPQEGGGGAAPIWEILIPENILSSYTAYIEDGEGAIYALGKTVLNEVVDFNMFSGKATLAEFTSLDIAPIRSTEEAEVTSGGTIIFVIPGGEDFLVTSPDWAGILYMFITPNTSDIALDDLEAIFDGEATVYEEGKTTIGIVSILIPMSENAVIPETEAGLAELPYVKIAKFSVVELTAQEALNGFIYGDTPLNIVIPAGEYSVPSYAFAHKTISTLVTEERTDDLRLDEGAFYEAIIQTNIPDPIILQGLRYIDSKSFKTNQTSNDYETEYSREIQLPQAQLTRIYDNAFAGGQSLRMTIPNTVEYIGDNAFYNFGGSQRTAYIADRILCSQEYTKEIPAKQLTMSHCDCSPLTTILRHSGATGRLATYTGAVIPQKTIDLLDELSVLHQQFITGCNIPKYPITIAIQNPSQQYTDFKAVQDKIIELGEVSRWGLKESYYNVNNFVIIGLNRPFMARSSGFSYGQITRDNLIEILATAFGYDDIMTFLNYAQNLADEYTSNSAGAAITTIADRLKYDGAIYTINGSFILPYAITQVGSSSTLCFYIVLSADGILSALFNSYDNSFLYDLNISNEFYNNGFISERSRLLYGRCMIFDERYNRPESEWPHLSIAEGTNITFVGSTVFTGSGIDDTAYGKINFMSVPSEMFKNCKKLKKFKSANPRCSSIENEAFMNSGIEEYEQPADDSHILSIGEAAFQDSKLQRIKSDISVDPNTLFIEVDGIGPRAFYGCTDFPKNESGQVMRLTLKNTVGSSGYGAFTNTALKKLTYYYEEAYKNYYHPNIYTIRRTFGESTTTDDVDITIIGAGTNYYNGLNAEERVRFNSVRVVYQDTMNQINISYLIANTLDLDFMACGDVSQVVISLLNKDQNADPQVNIGTLILKSQTMINVAVLAASVGANRIITQVLVPGALLENYRAQTQSLTFNPLS